MDMEVKLPICDSLMFNDCEGAGASATGMASVDTSKQLGRLATNIIPHILNLSVSLPL